MIRPTDLTAASTVSLAFTQPVWAQESRSGTTWFEADTGGITITGDVGASARGLGVEAHAERVLVHLRGERDVQI